MQNVIERFEPESSTESSDMTTIHGWAELVWSIKAGPGTYSAAHAVQLVPWDHIVPQLPGQPAVSFTPSTAAAACQVLSDICL